MRTPADAPPAPIEVMVPRRHRVVGRVEETADTATLLLEPVDGPPAPFRPGQFHMLWAFGVGEVPISISGTTGTGGPIAHTIRAVGPVTRALCATRLGTEIGVRGPFGTDWGLDGAEGHDILLVAGGIGLAPLRSALQHMLAERERFGRVGLLVGARSPDAILFARELEHWRGRFDTQVEITVDYAVAGWRGDVGVVTQLIRRATFDPDRTVALEVFTPTRGPVVIETLGPGEVLGWSWLFPPYRWHFDAQAVEPVRAVALDGGCLRGKCEEDPRLGYELTRRFAAIMMDRLQATRLRLLDVYCNADAG